MPQSSPAAAAASASAAAAASRATEHCRLAISFIVGVHAWAASVKRPRKTARNSAYWRSESDRRVRRIFVFFEGGEMVGAPSFGTYGQLTGTRSGPTYLHTEHTEMYTAINSRALLHHAQVLKLCENILIFARRVWEATWSCYRCATQTRARRS